MEPNSNVDLQENGAPNPSRKRRGSLLKYLGLAVVVIMVLALCAQMFRGYSNCSQALTDGYWLGGDWVSQGCVHQEYRRSDLKRCFSQRSKVILIGDKSDAQWYVTYQKEDSLNNLEIVQHSDLSPAAIHDMYTDLLKIVSVTSPVVVIHKLQPDSFSDCKVSTPEMIQAQLQFLKKMDDSSLVAVVTPSQSLVGEELRCKERVRQFYSNVTSPLYYIDVHTPSTSGPALPSDKDLPIEMALTLNLFCNTPSQGSCCVPPEAFRSVTTYLATCLLTCVLAVYLGVWLIFISGATFALTPHLETLSFDFDQFFSLLHCVGGVSAVLLYFLLADRLDYFARADAPTSFSLFAVAMVIIFCLSIATIKPVNVTGGVEVLSRDQSNEWRGWMILFMIISHYTKVDKVLMVRLLNELAVGTFLFLTGHAHFTQYWNTGELSCRQIAKKLLQMNALCVCVCLTLGISYGSYYLVAVLTHWYLSVVLFNSLWPPTNPAKLKRYTSPRMMVLIKFVITFVLLALLRFTQDFWLGLLSWGPIGQVSQSFDGSTDDLFYWFYRQRYTAFSGMTFGYITVTVGTTFKSVLSHYERQLKIVGALLSVLTITGYLVFLYTCENGQECSSMQTYIGILPILAYILLRNITILHHFTSGLLQEAGTHSLWLFLSHFHILSALNGRGLLVFFPGSYYLNALAVCVVYVYVFLVVRLSVTSFNKWLTSTTASKELGTSSEVDDSNA